MRPRYQSSDLRFVLIHLHFNVPLQCLLPCSYRWVYIKSIVAEGRNSFPHCCIPHSSRRGECNVKIICSSPQKEQHIPGWQAARPYLSLFLYIYKKLVKTEKAYDLHPSKASFVFYKSFFTFMFAWSSTAFDCFCMVQDLLPLRVIFFIVYY